jgi:DNA-binding Lrp family transcriptional regulator
MTSKEIVKEIMKEQSVSNAEMAEKLSITPAALWDRLNNTKNAKDLSVTTLNDMLRALGYKIQIVPRESRVPDKGYKVE